MADNGNGNPPVPSKEQDFIHREPPMTYQAPGGERDDTIAAPVPVAEAPPYFVTPLKGLQNSPAEVDCPYCHQVVKTEVRTVPNDSDGMIKCLICLVCCPLLLCYEGEDDTDHHCSRCHRKLTHRPHGGAIIVVAEDQVPDKVPSVNPRPLQPVQTK